MYLFLTKIKLLFGEKTSTLEKSPTEDRKDHFQKVETGLWHIMVWYGMWGDGGGTRRLGKQMRKLGANSNSVPNGKNPRTRVNRCRQWNGWLQENWLAMVFPWWVNEYSGCRTCKSVIDTQVISSYKRDRNIVSEAVSSIPPCPLLQSGLQAPALSCCPGSPSWRTTSCKMRQTLCLSSKEK